MIRQMIFANAMLALFATGALAHSPFASSTWDSTYYTPQGAPVQATVQFQGERGTYVTTSGTHGLLYNVRYSSGNAGGVTVISGNWQYYTGQRGNFTFDVNDHLRQFNGRWSDFAAGPQYRWDGHLRGFASPGPVATAPQLTQTFNPPQTFNP